MKLRLPALVLSLAVAIGLAAFLYFLGPFRGDDKADAREILERAIAAADSPGDVGLHSYQGVAIFEQITSSDDQDNNELDDPSIILAKIPTPKSQPSTTEMRVWYAEQDRFRIELASATEDGSLVLRSVVTDGTYDWSYVSETGKYTRQPADPVDSEQDIRYFLVPGLYVGGIDQLLAQMDNSNDDDVKLVGTEEINGREAYVIEAFAVVEDDAVEGELEESDLELRTRTYLDKEFLFTLAWETTTSQGLSFSLRFEQIEFNSSVDPSVFVFTPPPGAQEVDKDDLYGPEGSDGGGSSSHGSSSTGDLEIAFPEGLLVPGELPPRLEGRETNDRSADGVAYEADFLIREDGGEGYISAQERRDVDSVPDALRSGEQITVRGQDAWLDDRDGLLHVAWQEDDLIVYVIARGLSEEDLLAFIAAMVPSIGRSEYHVGE